MKLFKNYKKLYETELNNRKVLDEAKRILSADCKKYQLDLVEIRSQLQLKELEIKDLKEKYAKVRIELEDTQAYLKQEKEVSNALRKERISLKRKITNLKKGEQNGKEN